MTIATFRIPPSQKFAVAAAASFAVVALSSWGFFRAVAGVQQGHGVQADIRQKIDTLAEDRQRARASETLLTERESDISRISAFFLDRSNPIAFIEAVERAAEKTGATITLDIDEQAGGDNALRFRLALEGGENVLYDFVRVLELLPYKIEIQDMLFQNVSSESTPSQGRSLARLLLSVDVTAR